MLNLELHHEYPLLMVGVLLLAGFALGKVARRIGLPAVSGYILAGLFLGESVLGVVSHDEGAHLHSITEVALGLIAITIAGEFKWNRLRHLGLKIIVITAVQLFASFFGVVAVLVWLEFPLALALLMGAVASATAPAATIVIIQNLGAKGEFVDYLYGTVVLDDAGAIILFGLTMAIAPGLLGLETDVARAGIHVIAFAFGEVVFSLLLGAIFGALLYACTVNRREDDEALFIMCMGFIFLNTALADYLGLSTLLANMALGATLINISDSSEVVFKSLGRVTLPIYILFFVLAGVELRPEVLMDVEVLVLGTGYILARAAAKCGGVYAGALMVRAPSKVRNYLGYCLLPQAGVALGMVLVIQKSEIATLVSPAITHSVGTMINLVLMSVLINELLGPPLCRHALVRGAETDHAQARKGLAPARDRLR